MRYEEGGVQKCYVCACHFNGGGSLPGGGLRECLQCRYPWAESPGAVEKCGPCGGPSRGMPRPAGSPSEVCPLCLGSVPLKAILLHFETLLVMPLTAHYATCGGIASKFGCIKHNKEYRFCDGDFRWICSFCGFSKIVSDENDLRNHINEIRICCNNLRAMYSAIEYKENLIIQCKKCFHIEVVKVTPFHKEWLSSGNFGTPFCERKVTLISDLYIGDHLVFVRAFYEHHVIVVSIDLERGIFKQIGFTTPKKKGIDNEEYELTGKILMLEMSFKSIKDPIFVIDYLPLDTYAVGHVLLRAFSRLDEEDYSIFSNNCEHLSTWCKFGRYECVQVKKKIDKYAKIGTDIINTTVIPSVMKAYGKLDNAVKEDPTLSQIQAQVISKSQVIKENLNNSIKQMFLSKKRSIEVSPHTSKNENK